MLSGSLGWRGYVSSRAMGGNEIPQRVQNMVLRAYAARNDLHYLLSATEYAMDHCYMILQTVLEQIQEVEGILFYSTHQLPRDPVFRAEIYDQILSCQRGMCFAMEDLRVRSWEDIAGLEDILMCRQLTVTHEHLAAFLAPSDQ